MKLIIFKPDSSPREQSFVVPPYALFRNPVYFSPAPVSFWTDRWLHPSTTKRTPYSASSSEFTNPGLEQSEAESEVHTNTAAFIPFSYGPANCAGRVIALVEMRMVVALLLQRFEMRFVPEYDPNEWEKSLKDFSMGCCPF